MTIHNLFDIAKPKQWKTISSEDFDPNGKYSVYGANGIIGKANIYNHEEETVLITCRGATCGSINLSEPFSYVNGNAMALDELDGSKVVTKYLYYFLQSYNFNSVITGSAQPQITRESLRKVEIPLPDLETQNKIVAILDKAKTLLDKREKTIAMYDELMRATFLEMFGDIAKNPKGLEKAQALHFGSIITGNTPPRNDETNYNSRFIEWIKTDNITKNSQLLTPASEYLSETGFSKSRYVPENSLLVACIAGSIDSIGRSAISDRKVAFNQQINAIVPNEDVSVYFLYWMFKVSSKYIQSFATKGMKRLLTKGEFEKILLLKPSYHDQLAFESVAKKYSQSLEKLQGFKTESENLLGSLSSQFFDLKKTIDRDNDLELILQGIDLNKKDEENDIDILVNDVNLIRRLITRLGQQEFKSLEQYDKAKYALFRVMKEKENMVQQDFENEKIKLSL